MKHIWLLGVLFCLVGCQGNAQQKHKASKTQKEEKTYAIQKTDAEWKAQLTDMEYFVLRKKGTERAFTGKYNKFYEEGTYVCAGCGTKLYESPYKYNSGSGWPSFDRGFDANLAYENDTSHGMVRTEILCGSCGGHLGHIFNDGPADTTGKRHCINSVALKFIPKNETN
ncbi:peptide-methionine (R)-S-oxide reductase MsrB [Ascidiimonas aurantiaca]|uniref:peptide-methionine (R)-S-oxide reductase MsrB n=1 Tax=Ascidiimonas aurantiaca TaxID=1685432 RepID=UPI0030EE57BE